MSKNSVATPQRGDNTEIQKSRQPGRLLFLCSKRDMRVKGARTVTLMTMDSMGRHPENGGML